MGRPRVDGPTPRPVTEGPKNRPNYEACRMPIAICVWVDRQNSLEHLTGELDRSDKSVRWRDRGISVPPFERPDRAAHVECDGGHCAQHEVRSQAYCGIVVDFYPVMAKAPKVLSAIVTRVVIATERRKAAEQEGVGIARVRR